MKEGKGLQRLAQKVGGGSKAIIIQFSLSGAFHISVQKINCSPDINALIQRGKKMDERQ